MGTLFEIVFGLQKKVEHLIKPYLLCYCIIPLTQ